MPLEEYYAKSESENVTFGPKQLRFSASLIKKYDLSKYGHARIAVDPELRRIYFAFQESGGPGISRFWRRKDAKSGGKNVSIGTLYLKYDWLVPLKNENDPAKKQFEMEVVDPQNEEIYPMYKYFITLGYAWAPDRNFHDEANYPEEPGVYRLKKDGEVVRIGEGNNIFVRLKEHHKKYPDEVDTFDFEIVPNADERKAEQSRLFKAFRGNVGRLPKLNPQAS